MTQAIALLFRELLSAEKKRPVLLEKAVFIARYGPAQVSHRTNDLGLYTYTSYACVDHQSGTTNVPEEGLRPIEH